MKTSILRAALLFIALTLMAAACGGSDDSGAIEIEDARYRIARADLGAGYMSISNTTGSDVTLQGVSAEDVGRVEMHESLLADDGTMAMESRPDGFVIASGETVVLEPGGKHLMLFDPVGTEDRTFTLDFGDETLDVVLTYDAEASATTDAMADMDHSDDDAMADMEDADS